MIHSNPRDLALADQPMGQLMTRGEHLRALHANGGQMVDVEEPSIVDLVTGHPPVGETVGLLGEQGVEHVEAGGLPGCSVEGPDIVLDEVADLL